MHLGRNCCSPEAELIALLNFSIIEKRHLNKQHVQNRILCKAAYISITCPRKECLLRFQLNSTATSDGKVQKLGNDLCHDSDLIQNLHPSQL